MRNLLLLFLTLTLFVSCKDKTETTDDVTVTEEVQDENNGQEAETDQISTMAAEYQAKLDTGDEMLQTTMEYREKSDQLVANLYKTAINGMTESEQEALVKEQNQWLEKREATFKEEMEEAEKVFKETGVYPQLEQMTAHGVIVDMNFERAKELKAQ